MTNNLKPKYFTKTWLIHQDPQNPSELAASFVGLKPEAMYEFSIWLKEPPHGKWEHHIFYFKAMSEKLTVVISQNKSSLVWEAKLITTPESKVKHTAFDTVQMDLEATNCTWIRDAQDTPILGPKGNSWG